MNYFHQANCASLRTEDGWHFPDCDCERIRAHAPCPVCHGAGYVIHGAPVEGFGDNSVAVRCVRCAGGAVHDPE